MYSFYCNVVTIKYGNRVGDLVGFVIEDEDGNRKGISISEAEKLVSNKEIKGLKLLPYTMNNAEGEQVGTGNIIIFEDDRPILLDRIEWHKDLTKHGIPFSEKLKTSIEESPYS